MNMVNIICKIKVTKKSNLPKWLQIGNYYWIEYRIDEDRYWFCQKKGLNKKETWHSKKDLLGAIEIIKGITNRSKKEGYDVLSLIEPSIISVGKPLEEQSMFLYLPMNKQIPSDPEE